MEIPPIPPSLPAPPTKEERTWALVAHLSAFLFYLIPPIGQILGPLIIWIAKKDSSEFVEDQAREALNAQISISIYAAVAGILVFVLIGIPLLFALWLAEIVLVIVAAIKANDGIRYRYPLIFRLVK